MGHLIAKLAYKAQSYVMDCGELKWWHSLLWKSTGLLKQRLFGWLLIHNQILSWDNLKKHGWHGLSYCVLCKLDEEDVTHLFLKFYFIRFVQFLVLQDLNINGSWEATSVECNLWVWYCDQNFPLQRVFMFIYGGGYGSTGTRPYLKINTLVLLQLFQGFWIHIKKEL